MATILVADDELELLDLVSTFLTEQGYTVVMATDSSHALQLAFQMQPDLAILDIMLPNLDGITLCQRLREMSDMPILMLTALAEEHIVVQALNAGADDYITKPFSTAELLARVRANLRRAETTREKPLSVISIQDLMIDLARRQVTKKGVEVELTPTEFELLALLAQQPGHTVSHRQLLSKVWGAEYVDQVAYLRVYIRHLRSKLEDDPANPQILLNKPGEGYYVAP